MLGTNVTLAPRIESAAYPLVEDDAAFTWPRGQVPTSSAYSTLQEHRRRNLNLLKLTSTSEDGLVSQDYYFSVKKRHHGNNATLSDLAVCASPNQDAARSGVNPDSLTRRRALAASDCFGYQPLPGTPDRCGVLFSGQKCDCSTEPSRRYCNETSGWCGNSTAQASTQYDCPVRSCHLASQNPAYLSYLASPGTTVLNVSCPPSVEAVRIAALLPERHGSVRVTWAPKFWVGSGFGESSTTTRP